MRRSSLRLRDICVLSRSVLFVMPDLLLELAVRSFDLLRLISVERVSLRSLLRVSKSGCHARSPDGTVDEPCAAVDI